MYNPKLEADFIIEQYKIKAKTTEQLLKRTNLSDGQRLTESSFGKVDNITTLPLFMLAFL